MTESPIQRTTFARWLHHADQHLALDALGELSAAIRGDRGEPNPADLDELRCYLTSVGASADTHLAAAWAWSTFLAEQQSDFTGEVAAFAEWQEAGQPPLELSLADLLAELEFEGGPAAEESARRLLCDLAPWLAGTHGLSVRVQNGRVRLDGRSADRLSPESRYNPEARR